MHITQVTTAMLPLELQAAGMLQLPSSTFKPRAVHEADASFMGHAQQPCPLACIVKRNIKLLFFS